MLDDRTRSNMRWFLPDSDRVEAKPAAPASGPAAVDDQGLPGELVDLTKDDLEDDVRSKRKRSSPPDHYGTWGEHRTKKQFFIEKVLNDDMKEYLQTATDHCQDSTLHNIDVPAWLKGSTSHFAIQLDDDECPAQKEHDKLFKKWSAQVMPPEPAKPKARQSYSAMQQKLKRMENNPGKYSPEDIENYKNTPEFQVARTYHCWRSKCTHLRKKEASKTKKENLRRLRAELAKARKGEYRSEVQRLIQLWPESKYEEAKDPKAPKSRRAAPGGAKPLQPLFKKDEDSCKYLEQGYRVFYLTKEDLRKINACIEKHEKAGLIHEVGVVNRGSNGARGKSSRAGGRRLGWFKNSEPRLILQGFDKTKMADAPRNMDTQEWNQLYRELSGILEEICHRYIKDDVSIFLYTYSILKMLGHPYPRSGRQRLHADDVVEVNKWGASFLFSLGAPLSLRVVPGSHLHRYKDTLLNKNYKPRWLVLKPNKPCFICFNRSLIHGGEGYGEPNNRLHAYAELLPPGVSMENTVLHGGKSAPFMFIDSTQESEYLEKLDKDFNKGKRQGWVDDDALLAQDDH